MAPKRLYFRSPCGDCHRLRCHAGLGTVLCSGRVSAHAIDGRAADNTAPMAAIRRTCGLQRLSRMARTQSSTSCRAVAVSQTPSQYPGIGLDREHAFPLDGDRPLQKPDLSATGRAGN